MSRTIKFRRKKIKLRELYPYVPYIQVYVELIKGKRLPYFYVQMLQSWEVQDHFYFYCEDIKNSKYLVTYIVFKCKNNKVEIDYQRAFEIIQ
jgi:hypothetical protein